MSDHPWPVKLLLLPLLLLLAQEVLHGPVDPFPSFPVHRLLASFRMNHRRAVQRRRKDLCLRAGLATMSHPAAIRGPLHVTRDIGNEFLITPQIGRRAGATNAIQ